MKKFLFVLGCVLALVIVCYASEIVHLSDRDGTITDPGVVYTVQSDWETLETFAAGTTTPGVTARTYATFDVSDTNNAIYTIPPEWNAIRLRCSSTTDGDSSVFDIFLMNGLTDHYNRVATLTFTTGTQSATTSGHEYADTVAESNTNWHKSASTMSPTGNYIAEWALDVMGSRRIGISPTTITHTAVLEITGF